MNTRALFQHAVPELENLPQNPKILWYVSAGADFRSVSFLSDRHINNQRKHHGRELSRPDLFVFNGLGKDTDTLISNIRNNNHYEIFSDHSTRIVASGFRALQLNDSIEEQLIISSGYFSESGDYLQREGTQVSFFKVTVASEGESDTFNFLYFEHENIDFFNKIILGNHFQVEYLCATREGMGWGNCRKSIVDHVYKDGAPTFYIDRGFKPKYLILFNDFTRDIFIEAASHERHFTCKSDYANYPFENIENNRDATVFKLEYNN